MKQFRKSEDGRFICEECGRTFVNVNGLAQHVNCYHNTKDYYDKWLKEEGEGICKVCGKNTKFISLTGHYTLWCTKKCALILRQISLEESNIKNFGVKNVFQLEECKEKSKQTLIKKFGVDNPRKSKFLQNKAKETCKERYNDENYNNAEKAKQTCLEKYGVEHPMQLSEIKKKGKQTKKERHGNENYVNSEKTKRTKKERYNNENYCNVEKCKQTKKKNHGNENYNNAEKAKQTCLEKYGVENPFQSEECRENWKKNLLEKTGYDHNFKNPECRKKAKQTCKERYGVDYPSQNPEIHFKQQLNGYKLKHYKQTNLYYRGSYELDFLNNYYPIYPDIENGPRVIYYLNNKKHYYFSDYLIPSLNLVVEIKSSWIIKKQTIEIIEIKKAAVVNNGYKYLMIVDKKYPEKLI